MSFVPDDWFVRQDVVEELNSKILDIASYILDHNGRQFLSDDDDEVSDALSDAVLKFIDMTTMTEDETRYILDNVFNYCCIGFAARHGLLKEDPNGRIVLPKEIENI